MAYHPVGHLLSTQRAPLSHSEAEKKGSERLQARRVLVNAPSWYLQSGLLDGRPLRKPNSLSGYLQSGLLDGRPLCKPNALSVYLQRGLLHGRPLCKSLKRILENYTIKLDRKRDLRISSEVTLSGQRYEDIYT